MYWPYILSNIQIFLIITSHWRKLFTADVDGWGCVYSVIIVFLYLLLTLCFSHRWLIVFLRYPFSMVFPLRPITNCCCSCFSEMPGSTSAGSYKSSIYICFSLSSGDILLRHINTACACLWSAQLQDRLSIFIVPHIYVFTKINFKPNKNILGHASVDWPTVRITNADLYLG